MVVAYLIGGFLFLVSFAILLLMITSRVQGKKREGLLASWSSSVGMTYQRKDHDQSFANSLEGFAIRGEASLQGAMNIIRGEGQGFKTTLFDYFRYASQKETKTRNTFSAVLFEDPGWHWSTTQILPLPLPDSTTVYTQLDELYTVSDASILRNNEALEKHLIQHPEWHIELMGNRMLLYRNLNPSKPDAYQQLLRDALQLKMLIEAGQ
ncbi:MAG: hypothetical protein AAFQ98_06195 [Bacteroidota bacterium]